MGGRWLCRLLGKLLPSPVKEPRFKVKKLLFAVVLVVSAGQLFAQGAENLKYYVTIGAFRIEDNAKRFTEAAKKKNYNAIYALNKTRGLHYVYVLATADKREAFRLQIRLRATTEYKDAWVFMGLLGDDGAIEEKPIVEEKPVVQKPVDEQPVIVVPVVDSVKIKARQDSIRQAAEAAKPKPKPPGNPFKFRLLSQESGTEVMGEVHVQESSNATRYQAFPANQVVYIEAPRNREGTYTLVTQAAGYKPVKTIMSYRTPGGTQGAEGEHIIELPLPKAKRGDYIDFTAVKFFKNSSILEPASQNELDGLVSLMKEETAFKIRIHGHVNGKISRDAILIGKSTEFFKQVPENQLKKNTTASELSTERAEVVKRYLVSQGIPADRIKTKGEGGKIPLYPEGGTLGIYNDRVEVEIIKH